VPLRARLVKLTIQTPSAIWQTYVKRRPWRLTGRQSPARQREATGRSQGAHDGLALY
jgi:hypothetical protein